MVRVYGKETHRGFILKDDSTLSLKPVLHNMKRSREYTN